MVKRKKGKLRLWREKGVDARGRERKVGRRKMLNGRADVKAKGR